MFTYESMLAYTCEDRGQLSGASSLLLAHKFKGMNPGYLLTGDSAESSHCSSFLSSFLSPRIFHL